MTLRPWKDLQRPDLPNTPEGQATAKRVAAKKAKQWSKATRTRRFVGVENARLPENRTTIADLEERWFKLIDGDAQMKPATRAGHKSNWKANIAPKLGKHLIVALHVPALREWIRKLAEDLSPSTVRNNASRNTLTRFFADVKAERWVTLHANPMRDEEVRGVMPPVSAPDPDTIAHLTRPQCETLLARDGLPHDRFGVYLLAVTSGMRAGELQGLQWKHIDVDASVPHARVRQQLALPRGPGARSPWGRQRRTLRQARSAAAPSHARVAPMVEGREGWSRHVEPTEDGATRESQADDYVFPSPAGEAWRPRDADLFRDDLGAAKVPTDFVTPDGERSPFVFHDLRHTFASWLSAHDVDGEQVDRLLGQSPPSVRGRHYSAPSLEAMARAVATIVLVLPDRSGVGIASATHAAAFRATTPLQTTWRKSLRAPPARCLKRCLSRKATTRSMGLMPWNHWRPRDDSNVRPTV